MPSKTGYLQRYLTIIQKVRRNKYISMNELIDVVQKKMAFYSDRVGVSERTIRRDLREIREELYLNIKYSKAENGYYISDDEGISDIEMMLEPLNLSGALLMDKNLPKFLFTEKRKPKGMENLPTLIHAIKNSYVIDFFYRKYDNSSQHTRRVEPYALKEFKGRWYLLAMEVDGKPEERGCIKTWGVDRIEVPMVTGKMFQKNTEYDLEKEFADSFGIFSDSDKEAEEVILSFSPMGGKYNDSFPLHKSQETLIDDEHEFRIRLRVKLTYDFISELLSQSDMMKVIAPDHLKNKLIDIHKDAIKILESVED
jgi:predicted DNA-binding transcriptional regulator YafY